MTDLLGPAAAGAPRALPSTDPSITATIQFPDAADTWFGDCIANTAGTGTPYVAEFANRQLQQIRRAVRNSGASLTYSDDQLGYAIQQGLQWVGTFGGSANALTATMIPAPPALIAGTEIKGLVAATNTGAATLNANGGGPFPITGADGSALIGGEMVVGGAASLIYTGTSFVLLSAGPAIFQRILAVNTTFFVNNSTGSDTTGNGLTSGTAWATIAHALKVISTFNLGGNTITIQLALTGVVYAAPLAFNVPINGVLVIRGDPAAQASYVISGTPGASAGVVTPSGGNIQLIGVTVTNTAGASSSSGVLAGIGAAIFLQNVTLRTTSASITALMAASPGSTITTGAGVIPAGSAAIAISCQGSGANFTQTANIACSGSINFSTAFCVVADNAAFNVGATGLSITGTVAGVRHSASMCGTIQTGNAGANPNYFPGSASGATASGGQFQ